MFKSSVINELKKYHPSIINTCIEAMKEKNDLDFRINKDKFKCCKNISIDIAVMENTKLGINKFKCRMEDIGN